MTEFGKFAGDHRAAAVRKSSHHRVRATCHSSPACAADSEDLPPSGSFHAPSRSPPAGPRWLHMVFDERPNCLAVPLDRRHEQAVLSRQPLDHNVMSRWRRSILTVGVHFLDFRSHMVNASPCVNASFSFLPSLALPVFFPSIRGQLRRGGPGRATRTSSSPQTGVARSKAGPKDCGPLVGQSRSQREILSVALGSVPSARRPLPPTMTGKTVVGAGGHAHRDRAANDTQRGGHAAAATGVGGDGGLDDRRQPRPGRSAVPPPPPSSQPRSPWARVPRGRS